MSEDWFSEAHLTTGIRKRPAMYVGSTAYSGLINYLVEPVALLLASGAKHISASVDDAFEINSDAVIETRRTESGRVAPFEEWRSTEVGQGIEGAVLNALSEELAVSITTAEHCERLRFERGMLVSHESMEPSNSPPGTILRFKPDGSISKSPKFRQWCLKATSDV